LEPEAKGCDSTLPLGKYSLEKNHFTTYKAVAGQQLKIEM